MTYDQMQSIVELYLLEAQRDGINPCGFPAAEARELLLDFAQWFCDDVQDELKADLDTQEISMQDDGTMIFAPDDGLKPGKIVAIQLPLQPVGKSNFAAYAAEYVHRLRSESALGYLDAIQRNEEESEDE